MLRCDSLKCVSYNSPVRVKYKQPLIEYFISGVFYHIYVNTETVLKLGISGSEEIFVRDGGIGAEIVLDGGIGAKIVRDFVRIWN